MQTATITLTVPIDHPELDRVLGLLRQQVGVPRAGRSGSPAAEAGTADRSDVLQMLLEAELSPLEVSFLTTLAERAPGAVTYAELLELAGSPQKLGNLTAGLFRRWRSRGGIDENSPWPDVPHTGRRMSEADAAVVLERLAAKEA